MDAQETNTHDRLKSKEESAKNDQMQITGKSSEVITEHIEEQQSESVLAEEESTPVVSAKRGRKKKEPIVEEAVVSAKEELSEHPVAKKRGRRKKEETEHLGNYETEIAVPAQPKAAESAEPLLIAEETETMDIQMLVEKAESIIVNEHFEKVRDAMKLLLSRYDILRREFDQNMISSGNYDQEEQSKNADVLEQQKYFDLFRAVQNTYSKLRKQYLERQEAEKLRNYELKKQILEDLKILVDSEETLQKSWEDFKRLQQQWKDIGQVPPAQNQDLWNSFNHLVDLFLDKVKINKELRDLDYKKNLESKLEICEKIEELLLIDNMDEAFRKLHELQSQWRETGPVPSDKREDVNARFATSIEKLKEKRREQYESFKEKLISNLEMKRALVVKMKQISEQEITSAKAWGKKTEEVEELMKLWKQTGPVPKKHNEDIWTEFRSQMTIFYNEKKAFFSRIKDELTENYNRKLLLCKQAESLQDSTEWKKITDELITLQNEWKTIGPVPHRYSDSIWKRFRQACDTFFNKKQEYFSNLDKHEDDNLKAKQEIIEQMSTYEFGEDNKENLAAIKDFQRRFFEIGRVPLKEKDKIQSKFQKTVDGLLDKLKISRDEKRRFDLKQKYESMGSSSTGQSEMKKESFNISSKINKLESDINLWETNIGFFAKSKNADILTREFREKIEQAKAELLILKEKQKMIRGMMK